MYPAGVPGISVRHVRVVAGGRDLMLRVLESGPDREDVVLLAHGWGGSVYSFAELIPALANASYRVVAFDLPGHGLSEKPDDETLYTSHMFIEALIGVADAVGAKRFAFIGHSMGGSLGLELATRGERRITSLVLINSVGIARIPLLLPTRILSPRFVNRWLPGLFGRGTVRAILYVAFGTRGRPTPRDIDEYWAPTQFEEFVWACRAAIHHANWHHVAATKLRSLRVPVLVVTGGRDHVVVNTAKRAGLIPTARIVKVREGGHLVMQECASRTNDEILRFLRGVRS